ncbi:MAG: hypothetical protein HQL69_00690 [Magnetococcales bacterium]|nr:hypothetical protein [Magnetococcales bacterium]
MKDRYLVWTIVLMVVISLFPVTRLHADTSSLNIINAVATYKQFATAMIMENLERAKTYASGKALRVVRRKQYLVSKGKSGPIPKKIEILIVGNTISEQQDEVNIMGVLLARNSIAGSEDLATLPHRQDVTLKRHEDGWKVVYFMDNLEKCCLPAKE